MICFQPYSNRLLGIIRTMLIFLTLLMVLVSVQIIRLGIMANVAEFLTVLVQSPE